MIKKMQTPKRPCLTCRILITPTKENPSHCNIHKPTIKKYKYKDKRKRAYNDPEYRRNKALIKKAQRNCVLCNAEGNASNPLQVDHIIPISKGGTHAIYNLRVLCKACHIKRRGIDHK
jgi:5-methylcytosine-specific restriction protein A|tara:strand:+ start:185 stop:538 length:354 start_codon:yes stop_codon:yes gene_type:complete